jgi:hypothetical protein
MKCSADLAVAYAIMEDAGERPAALPVRTSKPFACKSLELIAAAAAADVMFCAMQRCTSLQKLLLFTPPPAQPPATLSTRDAGGSRDVIFECKRSSSDRVACSTGM